MRKGSSANKGQLDGIMAVAIQSETDLQEINRFSFLKEVQTPEKYCL